MAINTVFHWVGYWHGIKYETIGRENIPRRGEQAILAINHSKPLKWKFLGLELNLSSIDHLLVGATTGSRTLLDYRQIHFFALEQFFSEKVNPKVREYLESIEQIPFSKNVYAQAKETASAFLEKGEVIGIYSGLAGNQEYKSKLPARIALETNTPIVPVKINVISRYGKEPDTLVSRDTKAVQIIYKPWIDVVKFKEQHKGEVNGILERMLTDIVWKNVYGAENGK